MITEEQLAVSLKIADIIGQGKIGVYVKYKPTEEDDAPTYERFIRPPGSRSIVISPESKILLTSEYRHEDKKWDIRLPGGKVCDKIEDYIKTLN
ncbi:MAG: NUDIX hydrolase, partial [Microgenomates group bacterium GW2011_GWA2_44_7]